MTAAADASPGVGPLGEWYANAVSLPYPGRWLVLFTHAGTLVSVLAPGRSLRTTLPVFVQRMPRLLVRLGLPEAWVQAHARALGDVYIARAGARTPARRVLGTMTDLAFQVRAEAEAAGSFTRLDLDDVEMRLADIPLSAIGYSSPTRALAALAEA